MSLDQLKKQVRGSFRSYWMWRGSWWMLARVAVKRQTKAARVRRMRLVVRVR